MDIVLFHLHNSLSLSHINAVPTVLALLLSGNCPFSLFYANLSVEFHELSVNV